MDNIEKTIRILKIEPQNLPYEKEIANDLEGIQGEVEGLFECIYLDDNCILVCNEEGKLNGMELNRRVGNDIIAGPFFIGNSKAYRYFLKSKDNFQSCRVLFGQTKKIKEIDIDNKCITDKK